MSPAASLGDLAAAISQTALADPTAPLGMTAPLVAPRRSTEPRQTDRADCAPGSSPPEPYSPGSRSAGSSSARPRDRRRPAPAGPSTTAGSGAGAISAATAAGNSGGGRLPGRRPGRRAAPGAGGQTGGQHRHDGALEQQLAQLPAQAGHHRIGRPAACSKRRSAAAAGLCDVLQQLGSSSSQLTGRP